MKATLAAIIVIAACSSATSNASTLADLQADYSNAAQGINGIQYGSYLAPNVVVGTFSTVGWVAVAGTPPVGGGSSWWYGGEGFSTPFQSASAMHPAVSSLDPAVRRYTIGSGSEPTYTGTVRITGNFFDLDPSGATSGFVTVDGINLFNVPVPNGGPAVLFDFTVAVAPGSTIDFGVNAGANAFGDTTGISAIISTLSGVTPGAVPITTATPSQVAYIDGSYSSANTGLTFTFQSLDVSQGSTAILGPNDTLVLTNGPLTIAPGAVFTGNGLISGNVINHGLVRIPIVRLDAVSNIHGGYTQVTLPATGPAPTVIFNVPVGPTSGSILSVGGGSTGSFSTTTVGSGGAGNSITISAPAVTNPGVIRISPPPGAVGYDASLAITGTYTQSATGKLRLFIGGNQKGVTYSHLAVGQLITLSGEIQLVLEPDLFGFLPFVGETFDLLESPAGISIPSGLSLTDFVTQSGASYVPALTLTPYNSGIEGDPDQLDQIGEPIFTYALINGGTVLQATYAGTVPEPATWAMLTTGFVSLLSFRRGKRR